MHALVAGLRPGHESTTHERRGHMRGDGGVDWGRLRRKSGTTFSTLAHPSQVRASGASLVGETRAY
jgi:hypothetical protein